MPPEKSTIPNKKAPAAAVSQREVALRQQHSYQDQPQGMNHLIAHGHVVGLQIAFRQLERLFQDVRSDGAGGNGRAGRNSANCYPDSALHQVLSFQ